MSQMLSFVWDIDGSQVSDSKSVLATIPGSLYKSILRLVFDAGEASRFDEETLDESGCPRFVDFVVEVMTVVDDAVVMA